MKKTALVLLFLLTALIGCAKDTIEKRKLKSVLFDSSGEKAYEIEGITQGLNALREEYSHYIHLNFPGNLKNLAMASSENWKEFIDRREKQDMIIIDALRNDFTSDPVFDYFLRQGLRDAIVKAYLYKTIPNVDKIKDAQFSDDRVFLEKIYQENKKAYDEKNIGKTEAVEALKNVYLKKKRAVIDYILQQEQSKVMEKLKKQFKIEENPELLSKKPQPKADLPQK